MLIYILQGSVLGPILFHIYCAELSWVFERRQLCCHMYVDNTRLYVYFLSWPPNASFHCQWPFISRCNSDEKTCLVRHNLLPSENKTEATIISAVNTRRRAQPPVNIDIDIYDGSISLCVRDIDSQPTRWATSRPCVYVVTNNTVFTDQIIETSVCWLSRDVTLNYYGRHSFSATLPSVFREASYVAFLKTVLKTRRFRVAFMYRQHQLLFNEVDQ